MSAHTSEIEWRPLTQWPANRPRTVNREDANFARIAWRQNVEGDDSAGASTVKVRTTLAQTLKLLDRELSFIAARDVVVQIDIDERSLRLDGGLRSGASAKSPPIVLSFTRKKAPYLFACDRFRRWQDNLRAIALGLDGLRRLERYHIAQSGDQYRGWLALPGAGQTTTTMSTDQAAHFIVERAGVANVDGYAGRVLMSWESARDLLRAAKASTHPDAGGRTQDWTMLQEAERILRAHHGGRAL